jgi:hypothetical protein
MAADERSNPGADQSGGRGLRRLGWVAVALFTLKGLLWLALGAGAWRLLQ